MSFLSPWMLYGLAALAVPIIIHLWQRRRVVRIRFSTLRYLKIVAAKTSRSSRIENILLLVLRCLVFALLIAAAARPVISTNTAKLLGGAAPRTVILAIDNSMSMGWRSGGQARLDTAKKEALTILDGLKPGDDVAVMAVNDHADLLIAEPTVDHTAVRRAVEEIRQSDARSDFSVPFREARKMVERGAHGIRELYFFTDNQESGWRFDSSVIFNDAWKKSGLHPLIVRPDELDAANTCVSDVVAKTPALSHGDSFAILARVANHSSHSVQDLMEIQMDGERVARKPLDIAAGTTMDLPLEFQPPEASGKWARGVASIEGDDLPADDRFYFAVPFYQPPRVLIVEGQQSGATQLHSGYFLEKALVAGETSPVPPKVISINQLEETPLEGYSAVFLADVPGVNDRTSVSLENYLQRGGLVTFFPGDLASIDSLSHMAFLPAKPTGIRELPAGRLAAKVNDPAHPLLTNLWSADTPFPALPQHRVIDWKLNAGASTLITFANNVPLLVLGKNGPGRVVVVNASPDRAWGDFPLSPAFLPLVRQIARYSVEQTGEKNGFTVGDAIPFPAGLPREEAIAVRYPDGTIHDLPPGGKTQIIDRAEQSGFYEVSSTKSGMLEVFAVNADRRESDLKAITPAALAGIVPMETVAGLDNLKLWLARSRGNIPLWPVLLLLALLFFTTEAILANAMARHRSQGDDRHIQTGRLNKRRMGAPFRAAEAEAKP